MSEPIYYIRNGHLGPDGFSALQFSSQAFGMCWKGLYPNKTLTPWTGSNDTLLYLKLLPNTLQPLGKILILPHVSPTLFYFNQLKPIPTDIINGLYKIKSVGDQVEESVFIFGCYC